MPLTLVFEVRFESDYHVGSGERGRDGADAALLRDGDRSPVIRGLRPLLREGLRMLLQSSAVGWNGQRCVSSASREELPAAFCAKETPCPACAIFGSPRQPGRWRVSSARPRRAPYAGTWDAGIAASHLAHRVRIDPRQRRPEPAKLFSRELGDGREVMRFTASCRAGDSELVKQAALLVAAARMVRFLGGARRRGSGECRISLVKALDAQGNPFQPGADPDAPPTDAWISEFRRLWLQEEQSVCAAPAVLVDEAPEVKLPPAAGERLRRIVLLRSEEPLLIARRAEAANEFESLRYVPGSVLLGALAARAAERSNLADRESETYRSFHQVFGAGRVRFPMLYPCNDRGDGSLEPGVPPPLDLQTCSLYDGYEHPQENGHGVWNRGTEGPESMDECPRCGQRSSAFRGRFAAVAHPLHTLPWDASLEMHNRINPLTQRVSGGDLYGYHVLPAGRYFAGEIESERAAWRALLELTGLSDAEPNLLRLGKATGRGYGRVRVSFQEPESKESIWVATSLEERLAASGDELTLTLLTDAILPDQWGRSPGSLGEWVCGQLGLSTGCLVEGREASESKAVDGFHTLFGLPRWRDVALAAGSTATLRLAGTELARLQGTLESWEAEGIGLRRWEGFGRLAWNHPLGLGGYPGEPRPLQVPGSLSLGAGNESAPESRWERTLRKPDAARLFDPANGPFCALARLIWAEADQGVAAVLQRLEKIDAPEYLTGETIAGREKKSAFEKGQAGRKQIEQWLIELQQLAAENEGRPHGLTEAAGLRMIADVVARASCGSEPANGSGSGKD